MFGYPPIDRLATLVGGLTIVGCLFAILARICLEAHGSFALIGISTDTAQCMAAFLVIGAYGIMWAATMAPRFRAFRRRETIVITDAGITYRSSVDTIAASWDEVKAWSYVNLNRFWEFPATCEIVTDRGTFSFAMSIRDRRALIAILTEKAGGAFQTWNEDRILQVDPAKYGISVRDQGSARLYHYKTRTMRTMVAGLFVLVSATAATMEVNRWVSASPQMPVLIHVAIYAAVVAALEWVWRRYQSGGVITDDDSITKLVPPYRHSIAWRNLTECRYDAEQAQIRLRGTRSRMNISLWITDAGDLIEEIKERAPQAKMIGMDRRAVKSASTNQW